VAAKKKEQEARESNSDSDSAGRLSGREMANGYTPSSGHVPGYNAEFGVPPGVVYGDGSWMFLNTQPQRPKTTTATGVTASVTTRTPAGSSASARAPRIFSKKMKNRGWNSWARSIDPLTAGNYLLFTVVSGGEGSLLAIAPMGWEGRNIARFSHALIADVRGIKVYEYGQIIATLKSSRQASSLVRIHRQADNSIVYVVTTGTETIVHTSNEPLPYHIGKNVYTYGMLYSSDDRVTSSAFESGVVQYGSV
jgi:hypothetical protein